MTKEKLIEDILDIINSETSRLDSFQRLNEGKDWRKWRYSRGAGGSGASMRSMPIGLIYYGEKIIVKLFLN